MPPLTVDADVRSAEVDEIVDGSLQWNRDLGRSEEEFAAVEKMTRRMVEGAVRVAPAAGFAWLAGLTTLVYGVAVGISRRYGIQVRPLATFARWRAPFGLVWVFAAGLAAVLLFDGRGAGAGANLLCFACFVYFVQGLAVLTWQFRRRNVAPLVRVAFYLVAVLLALPFFLVATVSTGFFDSWFDFRRLEKGSESEE